MKTCIPAADGRGLKSRVNEHFGKAPYHVIIDIDTRTSEILEKQAEEHGHCVPARALIEKGVKQVLCKKIGKDAVERFRRSGIQVKRTTGFTVQEALIEQSLRYLPDVEEKDYCGSHDHDHDHGH